MTTFNKIIKTFFKITDSIDDSINESIVEGNNIDTSNSSFNLIKIIFSIYLNNPEKKNKHVFFEETINNLFLNSIKAEFISIFCRLQQIYHSLNKFAYLYKFNKAKIVVNMDMCLNEIKITDKNVICIYQMKSRYIFSINDLIKIINTSLTHSYLFFVEPKSCKNPYNNVVFNKSTLYNIYFFIKFKTLINPELVIKFFECNFNLNLFFNKYESLLREYSIQNFVSSSTNSIVVSEIKRMITKFNILSSKKIIIHEDFPQHMLIEIFKPYVLLYLTSCFSLNTLIKNNAYNKLSSKLFSFQKFNPRFGRRILKTTVKQKSVFGKKRRARHYEYNNTHVNFYEKSKDDFLQDHTKINTNISENYTIPNALNSRFIYTNIQNVGFILDETNIADYDDDDDDDDVAIVNEPADEDDDYDDDYDDDDDGDEDEGEDIMPSPIENNEEEESIISEAYDDTEETDSIS